MTDEYKVRAASGRLAYNMGKWLAASAEEACDMAREYYRRSALGRELDDEDTFKFYVVDKFDYEDDPCDEEVNKTTTATEI